ncbi:expressed unknown protein [Seminavis robusta]|uniref:Uncharacterized protein n=1 Tax=Seminavis robusta TaxID=568900 RepID=A0A9N8E9D8_9STRA|nr:expressed unknown protein [Seminavis robusta]|eukprot:Sro817_g206820.1 n/a (454) ;mRNA; f:24294-25655
MMEASEFDDELSCVSGDGPMFTVDDDEINIGGVIPDTEEVLRQESVEMSMRQRTRVGGAAVAGGVTAALLSVPLVAVSVTALAITAPVVGVTAAGGAAYMAATTGTSPLEPMPDARKKEESEEKREQKQDKEEASLEPEQDNNVTATEAQEVSLATETMAARSRLRWVPGVFQRTRKPLEKAEIDMKKKRDNDDASEHTDASSSELNELVHDDMDDNICENIDEEIKQQPKGPGLRMGGMMWIMASKNSPSGEVETIEEAEDANSFDDREEDPDQPAGKAATPEKNTNRGIFGWVTQRRQNEMEQTPSTEEEQRTTPTKALEDDEDDKTLESPTSSNSGGFDTPVKAAPPTSNSWVPPVLARHFGRLSREADTESGDGESDSSGSYSGGSIYESGEDDYDSESDDDSSEEEVVFGYDDSSIARHTSSSPKMALFSGEDLVEGPLAQVNPPAIV